MVKIYKVGALVIRVFYNHPLITRMYTKILQGIINSNYWILLVSFRV